MIYRETAGFCLKKPINSKFYLYFNNFSLILSEISFLSHSFPKNSFKETFNSSISFDLANTQHFSSTNSEVAHSEYQNTGTPINKASTVPIQKLSFVKLINPEESLTISCIPSGFHPVKIIVSQAIAFNDASSGQDQITINGKYNSLNNLIISHVSLTKLTNLPT
jgi:hypothetical protein